MNLTLQHARMSESDYRSRQLIIRDGRPIGHLTKEGRGVVLWLQNYAGYYSNDFTLTFDSEAIALTRAEEILTEWDTNSLRPTWIC